MRVTFNALAPISLSSQTLLAYKQFLFAFLSYMKERYKIMFYYINTLLLYFHLDRVRRQWQDERNDDVAFYII